MLEQMPFTTAKPIQTPNKQRYILNSFAIKRRQRFETYKMTIVTRLSVLRTVWGSVLRIHPHSGATYTLFLRIRGATVRVEKWRFFTVCRFGPILAVFAIKKLPQLKNLFKI